MSILNTIFLVILGWWGLGLIALMLMILLSRMTTANINERLQYWLAFGHGERINSISTQCALACGTVLRHITVWKLLPLLLILAVGGPLWFIGVLILVRFAFL